MKTNMNKKLEVRSEKLEANESAALPYSSNSYLLTPQCSANSVQSAKSVDSPVVRRSLFVARCSLSIERQRRAGMILLLVIALLVLLALMGTVFILMASADRKSAYASNSSASLNMAQQGVLNTVRGLMLNQTLSQTSQTLSIGVDSGGTFTADTQIARFWDYPEVGAMPTSGAAGEFYQSVTAGTQPTPTQYAPSEPWLVSNQPYELGNYYVPGEEVYYGDPFTGATGRAVYIGTINAAGVGYPDNGAAAADWSTAVLPPSTGYAVASGQATTGVPVISDISPYLYDPVTGNYDIPWGFYGSSPLPAAGSNITTPSGGTYPAQTAVLVPNAAVVEPRWAYNTAYNPSVPGAVPVAAFGDLDAMWNMLPYSDPNGTRYRFAVRIMDTSSLLNLNTGWIANAYTSSGSNGAEAKDPYGMYGAFIGSAPILNQPGVNIDITDFTTATTKGTPVQIGGGPANTTPGRIGNYPDTTTFYSLPVWQDALSEYELQFPSSGPTAYTYPTAPPAAFTTALFGTNSAMDLLTGAGGGGEAFGSPFYSRVATLMPSTLGLLATNYFGSGYRSLYTTYSFGRDVAPINLGTASTGTAPPKVNLNATITATNYAAFAQNLYNTLVECGYQPPHACAFLANYFTYRYGTTSGAAGFEPATLAVTVSGTSASLVLTAPSSSSLGSASLTTSDITGLADATFVGNAAQPFINELEVQITTSSTGTNPHISGWGVELMNPFPGAAPLNLNGWELVIQTPTNPTGLPAAVPNLGTALVCPTPPGTAPIGPYVAGGNPFAVITSSGAAMAIGGANTPQYTGAALTAGTTDTSMTALLERPIPGGGYAVADQVGPISIPAGGYSEGATPTTTWYVDVQRNNIGQQAEWGCDSAALYSTASTPTPTPADPRNLGLPNMDTVLVSTGPNDPGVPLYDRYYSGYTYSTFLQGAAVDSNDDLFNIDDFNCIAREGSYVVTGGASAGNYPISEQIDGNSPTAGVNYNAGMFYLTPSTNPGIANDPVFANEAFQAALYFDFAYDPRAAYTVADAGFDDPVVTAHGVVGEIPPTILSMTTLTDRSQSNPTAAIALPEGVTDLVRQAGKININTAGPDVLYSAFSEDGALWNGSVAPLPLDVDQLVVDAIGFRDRLKAGATVAPFAATTPVPAGYTVGGGSGYTSFGGVGYQSPADLLVAFIPTIESGTFPTALKTTPTTLQQRDAAWADVENFLTVRSDTFAVYGLVQALRLNPAYNAEHAISPATAPYLPQDWYNANQGILVGSAPSNEVYKEGSISTDPTSQYAEFILEGSRRFIAIVDRSYCNNGAAVQPHIVALKILPQ